MDGIHSIMVFNPLGPIVRIHFILAINLMDDITFLIILIKLIMRGSV